MAQPESIGKHVYLFLKDNKWSDPVGSYDQG